MTLLASIYVKGASISANMSQNFIESMARRPIDLSVTRAPSPVKEVKFVCGCRSKWVDQPCIMASIRKLDPQHILICSS